MNERVSAPESRPEWFWAVIERTLEAGDDEDAKVDALRRELMLLSSEDLLAFDTDYRRMLNRSYRWELWGAAYVINGGASDDGFDYFRDWLISQGKTVFERALGDPETLVGVGEPYEAELESFRYVVLEVHETKFGGELPVTDIKQPAEPEGKEWDEEVVDSLFPKLATWVDE